MNLHMKIMTYTKQYTDQNATLKLETTYLLITIYTHNTGKWRCLSRVIVMYSKYSAIHSLAHHWFQLFMHEPLVGSCRYGMLFSKVLFKLSYMILQSLKTNSTVTIYIAFWQFRGWLTCIVFFKHLHLVPLKHQVDSLPSWQATVT